MKKSFMLLFLILLAVNISTSYGLTNDSSNNYCGNGLCNLGETCSTCEQDCSCLTGACVNDLCVSDISGVIAVLASIPDIRVMESPADGGKWVLKIGNYILRGGKELFGLLDYAAHGETYPYWHFHIQKFGSSIVEHVGVRILASYAAIGLGVIMFAPMVGGGTTDWPLNPAEIPCYECVSTKQNEKNQVCGMDGQTYYNECTAKTCAQVDIAYSGACSNKTCVKKQTRRLSCNLTSQYCSKNAFGFEYAACMPNGIWSNDWSDCTDIYNFCDFPLSRALNLTEDFSDNIIDKSLWTGSNLLEEGNSLTASSSYSEGVPAPAIIEEVLPINNFNEIRIEGFGGHYAGGTIRGSNIKYNLTLELLSSKSKITSYPIYSWTIPLERQGCDVNNVPHDGTSDYCLTENCSICWNRIFIKLVKEGRTTKLILPNGAYSLITASLPLRFRLKSEMVGNVNGGYNTIKLDYFKVV